MNNEIGIPGWFLPENRAALESLIAEHGIKSVVEVGSFLGLSAVWFAQRVESVACVDLWHENANYDSDNNLVGTLRRWELPRDFFHLFRENVMRSGVWHKILPIRGHSGYVYGEVPAADLVYLDGDHSEAGFGRDVEIYRGKARRILCGDDYVQREGFGVIEVLTRVFPEHHHIGQFWWVDLAALGLAAVSGWFPPENREQLTKLIAAHDVRTVLEIGTCYGLSACWFAQRVEHVTCIDRWDAIPSAGVPADVYERFVLNIQRLNVADRITIIRGDSHSAETRAKVGPVDLVYVDGDHRQPGCGQDLDDYGPLARKVLCGDDYGDPNLELYGVTAAVDELLPQRQTSGRFWWVVRGQSAG